MQKYIARLIKTIKEFNLIEDGDVVAVGVSGGKDSMLLAYLLNHISKFYEKKFKVFAISLDCTGGKCDYSKVIEFFEKHQIDFEVVSTNIFEVVFEIRDEKNPCSLCANLRRGQLNSRAKERGATKIALGHHADDFIETFFLSMIYEGRLHTFSPKTYFSRADLTQIRPMLYLTESEVENAVKNLDIPVINNCCKANKNTKRQVVKNELTLLAQSAPNCKDQIFSAVLKYIKEKM